MNISRSINQITLCGQLAAGSTRTNLNVTGQTFFYFNQADWEREREKNFCCLLSKCLSFSNQNFTLKVCWANKKSAPLKSHRTNNSPISTQMNKRTLRIPLRNKNQMPHFSGVLNKQQSSHFYPVELKGKFSSLFREKKALQSYWINSKPLQNSPPFSNLLNTLQTFTI